MAGTAMTKSLSEIGAAVPDLVMGRIGMIRTLAKEQGLPARKHQPEIEREWKFICRSLGVHGLTSHEKRIECPVVLIGHLSEVIVRKSRVEVMPLAIDAFAHGADESCLGPVPDTRFGIRRDVGGIDRPERRWQGQSSGKHSAARSRMANVAISNRSQLAPALDEGFVELPDAGWIDS